MRKATGIMIEVTDIREDEVIGHLTCDQFRTAMNSKSEFIGTLVKRFNERKESIGEPERVREVIV